MDSTTMTRFEECNSFMGTCVPKEGWFLKALEGGWSNGGDCWKGRWWWEAIAASEEVNWRLGEEDNVSLIKFPPTFRSLSLIFLINSTFPSLSLIFLINF